MPKYYIIGITIVYIVLILLFATKESVPQIMAAEKPEPAKF